MDSNHLLNGYYPYMFATTYGVHHPLTRSVSHLLKFATFNILRVSLAHIYKSECAVTPNTLQ